MSIRITKPSTGGGQGPKGDKGEKGDSFIQGVLNEGEPIPSPGIWLVRRS